jgi:hypothetical protein
MMRAGFKISIEWTGPDVGRLGDWERDGEQGREIVPRDKERECSTCIRRGIARQGADLRDKIGGGRVRVQERGHLVSAFF